MEHLFSDWTGKFLGDTLRIPTLYATIGAILVSVWLWPKFNAWLAKAEKESPSGPK
jgi:hypothetical protein